MRLCRQVVPHPGAKVRLEIAGRQSWRPAGQWLAAAHPDTWYARTNVHPLLLASTLCPQYLIDLKTGGNGPRVRGGDYLNYQGAELSNPGNGGTDFYLVVMGEDGHLYRYPKGDVQYCKRGMGEPQRCRWRQPACRSEWCLVSSRLWLVRQRTWLWLPC